MAQLQTPPALRQVTLPVKRAIHFGWEWSEWTVTTSLVSLQDNEKGFGEEQNKVTVHGPKFELFGGGLLSSMDASLLDFTPIPPCLSLRGTSSLLKKSSFFPSHLLRWSLFILSILIHIACLERDIPAQIFSVQRVRFRRICRK